MLKDILLVTRNYKGTCEENFVTTFDDFVNEFCEGEDSAYTEMLREVLNSSEPYVWDATYYEKADVSFDIRVCQNEADLITFLEGKYNDSIEKMEERNPGASYGNWYWKNRPDFFSKKAIEQISKITEDRLTGENFKSALLAAMPEFPFAPRKSMLSDLINDANASRMNKERGSVSGPLRGQDPYSL